jgi:hypothetical protein
VLIACWSPKGGSGTTVFAAGLALALATRFGLRDDVVLADLAGDLPAALGLPEPEGPGLHDWLAAGAEVPEGALARLERPIGARLRLLPLGTPTGDGGDRNDALADRLAADGRPVVADCGAAACGPGLALAAGATVSLIVLRPCYLGLRRALAAPIRPSGAVLVVEPQRSLGGRDVEDVLGVPVVAQVPLDPAVARAVDAGLLANRLPRPLGAAVRRLATDVLGPSGPSERHGGRQALAAPLQQRFRRAVGQ